MRRNAKNRLDIDGAAGLDQILAFGGPRDGGNLREDQDGVGEGLTLLLPSQIHRHWIQRAASECPPILSCRISGKSLKNRKKDPLWQCWEESTANPALATPAF